MSMTMEVMSGREQKKVAGPVITVRYSCISTSALDPRRSPLSHCLEVWYN